MHICTYACNCIVTATNVVVFYTHACNICATYVACDVREVDICVAYIHACMHTYRDTHTCNICATNVACAVREVDICVASPSVPSNDIRHDSNALTRICIHAWVCVYAYICIHAWMCVHACNLHTCMDVCACV